MASVSRNPCGRIRNWGWSVGFVVALLLQGPSHAAEPTRLEFSGLQWNVKHGPHMGPGPNAWDRNNVWVDDEGRLHLKISQRDGKWACAEVSTVERLHFGTYEFQTISRLDQFDPNVVLGLFNYPPSDVGPDTTHEIDIEFAHWGRADAPLGNFTVWPVKNELKQSSHTFDVRLRDAYTTHRFDWRRDQIAFASVHGHAGDTAQAISRWLFDRQPVASYISAAAMPIHVNLWLFQGHAPTDGKEVEVIIKKISYQKRPDG